MRCSRPMSHWNRSSTWYALLILKRNAFRHLLTLHRNHLQHRILIRKLIHASVCLCVCVCVCVCVCACVRACARAHTGERFCLTTLSFVQIMLRWWQMNEIQLSTCGMILTGRNGKCPGWRILASVPLLIASPGLSKYETKERILDENWAALVCLVFTYLLSPWSRVLLEKLTGS
jgi:hypothetical protein